MLRWPYLAEKCPYGVHCTLKRLQITSSFGKWQNQNYGIICSGVMMILAGTVVNVPIWEYWDQEG